MTQTYFTAIEDEFTRLRGTPFLLAATDFEISRAWQQAGVPLDVVIESLRTVLESRADDDGPDRVVRSSRSRARGLKIADAEVWRRWKVLGGRRYQRGQGEPSAELATFANLNSLANEVRLSFLGLEGDRIAAEVENLEGSIGEIETALTGLRSELVAAARKELGAAWVGNQARRAERELSGLRSRLHQEQWRLMCEQWVDEAARRVLKLPTLSLFT